MAVVTWHKWHLLMVAEEMVVLVVAVVEIEVSEETVKMVEIGEMAELATETVVLAMALAMAMVAEPTSTRILVEAATPKCAFHQIQINSQFLT